MTHRRWMMSLPPRPVRESKVIFVRLRSDRLVAVCLPDAVHAEVMLDRG